MWLARRSAAQAARPRSLLHARAYLTDTAIESLAISARSKRVLREQLRFEFLTRVQRDSLPAALAGRDVLAKGKTGNGKTLAFLLPAVENLLLARESHGGRSPHKVATLVLSPTRELAGQIAVEAEKLAAAHGLRTACLVGGTSMSSDVRHLTNPEPLDVLVATPGRLQAHLDANSGNIRQKLQSLRVLVLDEADRLLDMGFRQEIMKIIAALPTERQTLLFSATLPASTEELKRVALRSDYAFVDTIDEDDHQTNVQTVQEFVTCDLPSVFPVVESIIAEHTQAPEYKILVFLPTARSAQFAAQLFIAAGFPNVLEIHSRKSQSARTKAADAFRSGKKVIMFSSDVSARGVDYPDVSLVLQVGLTDRDQYIHRLGRTARAGMEGRGILVLADFERPFLQDLTDLPLVEKEVSISSSKGFRTNDALAKLKPGSELEKSAVQSYQAWLGFYNSNQKKLGLDKETLVELAEHYSHVIGLSETPRIDKRILRKMGLFGVKGLDPASESDRFKTKSSSRAGGGSRGGDRSDRNKPARREPRNFAESSSTPAVERYDMSDLKSLERFVRDPDRSSESPRERYDNSTPRERYDRSSPRSTSEERRGGRYSERGDRDRSNRSDDRFGGSSRDENRGRRVERFEKQVERPSSFSSDRRPRGGDREDSAPSRDRFNRSRDGRGGDRERSDRRSASMLSPRERDGREGDDGKRSDRRASSSSSPRHQRDGSKFRGGRSRSEEPPQTTSHRRSRGEQRRREREHSGRHGKRF